uniref:Uncharacterized protein n=1 Tax=Rhizophora mucronata TaxID=61149 RepID=A0A2P2KJN2_RHIMU
MAVNGASVQLRASVWGISNVFLHGQFDPLSFFLSIILWLIFFSLYFVLLSCIYFRYLSRVFFDM